MPTNSEYTPLKQKSDNPSMRRKLKCVKATNVILNFGGSVTIGLLATVMNHTLLEKIKIPLPVIVIVDIVCFLTSVSAKAAVGLYFNEPTVENLFKKITSGQIRNHFKWPDTFTLAKGLVNACLSLNVSLFWGGLVKISSQEFGNILKKFKGKTAQKFGHFFDKTYCYAPFVFATLYICMVAYPVVHKGAWAQKKKWLSWLKEPSYLDSEAANINEKNFFIKDMHKSVLKELKNIINTSRNDNIQYPIINGLYNSNQANNPEELDTITEDNLDADQITTLQSMANMRDNDKHQPIIKKISALIFLGPKKLAQLYLTNKKSDCFRQPSRGEEFFKYGLALGLSALTIYGWRNVLGLSPSVWGSWGVSGSKAAKYFVKISGILAYYSIMEVVLLTVYPLSCNLFDIGKDFMSGKGLPPYVFSKKTLGLVIGTLLFVGLLGGIANSEQSYLDNESTFNIVNACFASLLVDALGIYVLLTSRVEASIKYSKNEDDKTILKQKFLQLRDLGLTMRAEDLEENNNNVLIQADNESSDDDDGEEQEKRKSNYNTI